MCHQVQKIHRSQSAACPKIIQKMYGKTLLKCHCNGILKQNIFFITLWYLDQLKPHCGVQRSRSNTFFKKLYHVSLNILYNQLFDPKATWKDIKSKYNKIIIQCYILLTVTQMYKLYTWKLNIHVYTCKFPLPFSVVSLTFTPYLFIFICKRNRLKWDLTMFKVHL